VQYELDIQHQAVVPDIQEIVLELVHYRSIIFTVNLRISCHTGFHKIAMRIFRHISAILLNKKRPFEKSLLFHQTQPVRHKCRHIFKLYHSRTRQRNLEHPWHNIYYLFPGKTFRDSLHLVLIGNIITDENLIDILKPFECLSYFVGGNNAMDMQLRPLQCVTNFFDHGSQFAALPDYHELQIRRESLPDVQHYSIPNEQ
jgi:hypothetical protein